MLTTPRSKSKAAALTQSGQEEEEVDFGVLIHRKWQLRKAEAAAAAAAERKKKKRTSESTTRRTSTQKRTAATDRVTDQQRVQEVMPRQRGNESHHCRMKISQGKN